MTPSQAAAVGTKRVDGYPIPVPPAGRDWLTVPEIAAAFGTSPKRVYTWITVGITVGQIGSRRRVLLRRVKMGGKAVRVYPDAILAFLKETSAPPSAVSDVQTEGDEQRKARLATAQAELAAMGITV